MTEHYSDDRVIVYQGDCREVMAEMDDECIDAIVCDPPYDLTSNKRGGSGAASVNLATPHGRARISTGQGGGFMGKSWDATGVAFDPATWKECMRVLKPGGHLLAFGGSRTWHRMAVAIEDAGFEMRDSIAWLYGSGFPKSMDVSKAIDKAAGAAREVVGKSARHGGGIVGAGSSYEISPEVPDITAPATDAAKHWEGWGTAMKPAFEPIVCARKPLNPVPWDWRLVATVHHALAGLLWLSLSDAKRAEIRSASKNHALPEAWCVSALVSAATGTSLDEFAKTATFNSQATASTCWNIVSSWSAILGALSDPTSTCTTSMKSSTTTGLRTLNSLLAPVISLNTMPACECLLAGRSSRAPSVASSSSEEWDKWTRTLSVSAPASAIEGIALAVRGALAAIADDFSSDLPESIAQQTATTGAGSSKGSHAFEPIVVARKPLGEKTVAANVLKHGTGALNIDATRVGDDGGARRGPDDVGVRGRANAVLGAGLDLGNAAPKVPGLGRWPANVVLDGVMADELDAQSGVLKSGGGRRNGSAREGVYGNYSGEDADRSFDANEGGASRFFPTFRYQAKAPSKERPKVDGAAHPTVKPLELMRWLIRLVTPPEGVLLDPFAGSGTTLEAAMLEGVLAIGIEFDPSHLPLIMHRIDRQTTPTTEENHAE